ncbi:hypothetical protein F5887DRAFT_893072 [Amanita rubescens]|nr:hypothetical protein F5887DRAFT_893072 [Amanita rubescens]
MLSPSTPEPEVLTWTNRWQDVQVAHIIDSPIVSVDADTTVEDACEILLKQDILCLAVKNPSNEFIGLFDFADLNAFLTLAATRHTLLPEDIRDHVRINQIVSAAKAGKVPVQLVSNLSEKNPLQVLPDTANILDLLKLFSLGTHRVLIKSTTEYLGIVSDTKLLSWFAAYAKETPSFHQYSSKPLNSYALPSLNLHSAVVAATSNETVLDAMRLMSEDGVSSIAVLDEETGNLLSAVSVTDIGRVVVPSESNQILNTPLHRFVTLIKAPFGSTDGIDKYPGKFRLLLLYSVYSTSELLYTIEKLLATNAHRVFVTSEPVLSSSPVVRPASLSGVASVVDILSLFARLAKIPDVDPSKMQRHRRASSSSSSKSERDKFRSRSNSRTSYRGSPVFHTASPPIMIGSPDSSISALDSISRR